MVITCHYEYGLVFLLAINNRPAPVYRITCQVSALLA